jgi:hypothetical protein
MIEDATDLVLPKSDMRFFIFFETSLIQHLSSIDLAP